jgi:hypothetical protein
MNFYITILQRKIKLKLENMNTFSVLILKTNNTVNTHLKQIIGFNKERTELIVQFKEMELQYNV